MLLAKILVLISFIAFSNSYRRNFNHEENSLKSEIQKYKSDDCETDESSEDFRSRGRRKFNKNRSKNFGLDFGRGGGYFDQYDSQSTEEPQYHPNPFLYIGDRNVGYEGAFGDNMEGYIPQDMRNARKSSGKMFQNRYSNRQGGFRSYRTDVDCVSQCIFNNMDIMEEDGTPSETLFMKWAQDKIKNDRKRISALKDIRRCFLTASNSAKEDGCEFSKYLSDCLNLDLDDDYSR